MSGSEIVTDSVSVKRLVTDSVSVKRLKTDSDLQCTTAIRLRLDLKWILGLLKEPR